MSESMTKPFSEVVDYCSQCGAEIKFGQIVIRYGRELLCDTNCLCDWVGADEVSVPEPAKH
ncbi:hypothetical protein [Paenibacillus donghaensis]|uniref:Uncharacterized protein n=1 Tax=Paenibacillus donghaensis TaxID=414771 RepID=A0A2Z2K9Y9_9BACL|nr:hypothetical protein [Paenibacillus donghaensis]ASA22344.1 hypothetical protein B9T62_17065 [Paenibacillus donghaensis]